MRKLSEINENVLTDIIDRSRTGSLRKEDIVKPIYFPKDRNEFIDILRDLEMYKMKYMDLRMIDVSKIKDMFYMFKEFQHVEILDVRGWDVSNTEDMENMFKGCDKLTEIKGIEDWDVSNVRYMKAMFYHCDSLEKLDITRWEPKKLQFYDNMFTFAPVDYDFIDGRFFLYEE